MQEAVAGTSEVWANLTVAEQACVGNRGVVGGNKSRGGLDLLSGRRSVFIVTGECDADAACVDSPVARVPADGAILQQSLAGAVRAHQPVIGEENHAALAKVAGPDGLAPDRAAHDVVFQIVQPILAQQTDSVELRQGDTRL